MRFKIILLVAILAISFLAFMPFETPQIDGGLSDKVKHVFAFFVLYLLTVMSYQSMSKSIVILLLFFYGFFIECVQYFLPYRSFSLLDVLADIAGVGIGLLSMLCFEYANVRIFKKHKMR